MGPLTLYLGVLLAAFGESSAFVGLLVPGVGVVLAAGVVAARGGADPLWVGGLASLGSVAGFGLSYRLGRAGGPRLGRWHRRAAAALEHARAFFARHGAWSVFWGHFFGPIRALVPFAAGAADLPPRLFWPAAVGGGVAWGYGLTLAGAVVSGGWTLLEARLGRASVVVALLAALLYLALRLSTGILLLGLRLLPRAAEKTARWLQRARGARWLRALTLDHPGLGGWLARRLSPARSAGLVLTVGAAACLASAWLFAGVLEDLWFHDPLVKADRNVFHLLQVAHTPELDRFFLAVTQLAGSPVVAATLAAGGVALWLLRRRFEAVVLATSYGVGQALLWLIKEVIARPRPTPPLQLVIETSGAFPSNHSFSALALYGFLAYLACRSIPSARGRAHGYAAAGVLIVAVGVSRLYLGVHWLSDVVGGYALAGIWLATVITATEVREGYGAPRAPVPVGRARAAAAAVAACVLVVWLAAVGAAWQRYRPAPAPSSAEATLSAQRLPAIAERLGDLPMETIAGTSLGHPQAILVGSAETLAAAGRAAGWRSTRPMNAPSLLAHVLRVFRGREDPEGPVAPVFWRGAPQDLAFARPEAGGRRIVYLWRGGKRLVDQGPVWALFERISPPARRLFGVPLPPVAVPARTSAFALALEGSGAFRSVHPGAPGLRLLLPVAPAAH